MKLLEYEAKHLLRLHEINVPQGVTLKSTSLHDEMSYPTVLKSQVPTGGRGKAGGVVAIQDSQTIHSEVSRIFSLKIKGFTPATLLAESLLEIKQEFYLSLLIDKSDKKITLLANKDGGVEVEDNNTDTFLRIPLAKDTFFPAVGEKLADEFDLPEKVYVLQELVEKLYKCFVENDALLLEVNPLVLTEDGDLIAGDCKMELDDSAAFRHADWDFEQKKIDSNFVTLNKNGSIATIANGAGLAMATVDAVASADMQPANFLDIGGGASKESVLRAFEKIMDYPNITAIVINIFAGITRCDEVAKAIISAKQEIKNLPPLYVRLAGTNADEAKLLLESNNMELYESLPSALTAVKKAT